MIDIDDLMDLLGEEEWSEEQEAAFEEECDAEWARIEAMTPAQITAELHSFGYTDAMIAAAVERCMDTVRKHGGKVE